MFQAKIVALLLTSFLLLSDYARCGAGIISDPLEPNDGWLLSGGDFASFDQVFLPSNAGTFFWGSAYNRPATVGLSKQFPHVYQPGTYRLRIDVAGLDSIHSVELAEFTQFGLTGLVESAESTEAPTPLPFEWRPWELRYTVRVGSASIGQPIGFSALYQHTGDDEYLTYLDNLNIDFTPIPEPSMATLFVTACIGGGIGFKLRRPRSPQVRERDRSEALASVRHEAS